MRDGVSVIICCYNSSRRLPETLRHLSRQKTSPDLNWELIVVDNASTDATAQTAIEGWPKDALAPLRVISESRPGLAHARQKGVNESRYGIIAFIDDDNWAAPDWISRVAAIFEERPEVGACGGRTEPRFEIAPPAWFDEIQGFYAVGRQHAQTGDITYALGTLLFGAGLCLRASALKDLFLRGFSSTLTGRKGASLSGGEDTEICFALRALGWRLWYDDSLVLQHFIPQERLQWSYALRLFRGAGQSAAFFDLYLLALENYPFKDYPVWKKTWLYQLLKTLGALSRVFLLHPIDAVKLPEASIPALVFEMEKNKLASIWALQGSHAKIRREIAAARWNRRGQLT